MPANNHYTQWTDAIKGDGTTSCPFSYSGPLTETVLLGNVAVRTGQALHWDSDALRCDEETANALLKRDYRAGWGVKPL